MFAYPINLIFGPRSFYPRTRNFHQPFRPCSYHYNNAVPPYNFYSPYNYYDYDDEDKDQLLQQLKQQEERDEAREQQAQQQEESTFTTDHQPRRSFKVKIQGSDDEIKSTINKSQAAHKIFNFIKNQKANKQTRKILNKLHILRMIEDELKVHKTKFVGNLTFDEEHEEEVLSISIENKRFLEYEDKTVKLLDKLDRIQSEGIDIIRERRKFLVKFAQTLLTELDYEKEKQWKEWKKLNENSDITPVPSSVVSENDSEEPISTLPTELNNIDIETEDNSSENLMDASND